MIKLYRFFNELYLFLLVNVIIVILSVYSDDSIYIYKYIACVFFSFMKTVLVILYIIMLMFCLV